MKPSIEELNKAITTLRDYCNEHLEAFRCDTCLVKSQCMNYPYEWEDADDSVGNG